MLQTDCVAAITLRRSVPTRVPCRAAVFESWEEHGEQTTCVCVRPRAKNLETRVKTFARSPLPFCSNSRALASTSGA